MTKFFFNIIVKHEFEHICIFIDTQTVLSSASGNLFELPPKSFNMTLSIFDRFFFSLWYDMISQAHLHISCLSPGISFFFPRKLCFLVGNGISRQHLAVRVINCYWVYHSFFLSFFFLPPFLSPFLPFFFW